MLRHGAYDIFNEDKSGKAEAESNEFVQEDIDSILQRRSKVVVHDNTGSSSGAAGGTFSKATFKVSKSTGDQSEANGTVDDIDIEDPDFWKKMIGEPKADEDMDILLTTKRRQRKQITSYSEQEYTKNLEEALGDGDSDSDATDHSDEDVVFRQSGTRSKWGGAGAAEWSKDEADNVAKVLATVGYGRLNWDAFTKIAMLRKPFATAEVSLRFVLSVLCY